MKTYEEIVEILIGVEKVIAVLEAGPAFYM